VTEPIRILVVDDHGVVRTGVVAFLERQGSMTVVAEAESIASALDAAATHRPDVAVVDVQLPDGSGVSLCTAITDVSPETRVVMFTSFAEAELLDQALEAGASGYVLKRMDLDELSLTVKAAHAGERRIDPRATAALEARRSGAHADARLERLSHQERRVLALIAEGHTNRQIAASLDLAEKTVKNYVSSVLRKLGMTRRSEAAAFMATQEMT
jgi:two-component system response regulator DevR